MAAFAGADLVPADAGSRARMAEAISIIGRLRLRLPDHPDLSAARAHAHDRQAGRRSDDRGVRIRPSVVKTRPALG